MRECEHFKNWSEEFVNLECWFYGWKTGFCLYDTVDVVACPWQGKPPLVNSSSKKEAIFNWK